MEKYFPYIFLLVFCATIVVATSMMANNEGIIGNDQIYGNIWFHNDSATGIVNVISTKDVWINISGFNHTSGGNADQNLNGFTYDNTTQSITATVVGTYHCVHSESYGNAGNNQEYQFSIAVDGAREESSDSHRKIGASGDVGNSGNNYGVFSLTTTNKLTLMAVNRGGTADLTMHNAGVFCERVGA